MMLTITKKYFSDTLSYNAHIIRWIYDGKQHQNNVFKFNAG